jgi:3-hydroxybutyryl-CoA dehydrogenase
VRTDERVEENRMKIAVVGAGTMGNGIAQVAAFSGHTVTLQDLSSEALDKGLGTIRASLRKIVDKMETPDRDTLYRSTLQRIRPVTDLADLAGSDFVIEAVFEDFQIKSSVFRSLEDVCPGDTPLASNTSSISITRLAAGLKQPERAIGMHFMNPVPLMKLVEIVRGMATGQAVFERTKQLATDLGKTPVEVRDFPGFVSNRVLMPMINEAIFALMEGVADEEAIDQVMKLGMNHPMGPLRLADLIGLDVCLDIMNVLYEGFKDSKYRPCPLLQKMVDAGWLGRKTGRGFYDYREAAR